MQPELDSLEKILLQTIDEEGVIRGSVLRRRARIEDPSKMLEAVGKLINHRLVAVSGSVANEWSMQEAFFSPVPSNRELAKASMKR